tara:strand:- start:617 stop:1255 length:639 start_codon:yes stop_codon:yes gene_type:complete
MIKLYENYETKNINMDINYDPHRIFDIQFQDNFKKKDYQKHEYKLEYGVDEYGDNKYISCKGIRLFLKLNSNNFFVEIGLQNAEENHKMAFIFSMTLMYFCNKNIHFEDKFYDDFFPKYESMPFIFFPDLTLLEEDLFNDSNLHYMDQDIGDDSQIVAGNDYLLFYLCRYDKVNKKFKFQDLILSFNSSGALIRIDIINISEHNMATIKSGL